MILETKRLLLRKLTITDLNSICAILQGLVDDPKEVESYLNEVIESYERSGFGMWGVVLKNSQELIGLSGFMKQLIDKEERNELSIILASPFEGKGYATEVLATLSNFAFNVLNMDQFVSLIDPNHEKGVYLAQALGMHLRKKIVIRGSEVHLYVLLKKMSLKPYSESYPTLFAKEKGRIAQHLTKNATIEHVGSTSIPHLGGKEIIDIAIFGGDVDLSSISTELQDLGYELRKNRSPERLFFRSNVNQVRYHLHLMSSDSLDGANMIAFRDYLKNRPEEAKNYSLLKQKEESIFKQVLEKIYN